MPTVNVYMPAYEAKREHIQAAVESVLAQTMTDWTLLIQDDHSIREDVRGHVEPYLERDNIHYRRNEKNIGIGPNWNACRDFGDAPYIAYLFHDDLWKPEYLEKAMQILEEHPHVGFVSLGHTYLQEGRVQDTAIYDEVEQFIANNISAGTHKGQDFLLWWAKQGLRPNIIGEPSFVVLRRSLVERVGEFHETMPQFLDSEYWIRCLLQTDWYYLPDNLGEFRVHPGAASAQNDAAGAGKFDRFTCFQMLINRLPKEKKPAAKLAFTHAFDEMVAKFFQRKKAGKKISNKGSGELKKFCLKHPIFTGKALVRYWMKQK